MANTAGCPYGEDVRPHPPAHRFGGGRMNRGRGRAALNHVSRYLKNLVEVIAKAKLRRMRRELERRGHVGHSE